MNIMNLQKTMKGQYLDKIAQLDIDRVQEDHESFLEISNPIDSKVYKVAFSKQDMKPQQNFNGHIRKRSILGDEEVFNEIKEKIRL